MIVSSPLQRAVDTAATIASRHRIAVRTDERLEEWALGSRWAGRSWESLPTEFPGELEAYLEHPADLPFTPEPLDRLADRMTAVAMETWQSLVQPAHAIVVSHQDPIEAVRRRLTRRGFSDFHGSKPTHAAVVTLVPVGAGWEERELWAPADV
jgi:broad specificity phosphatase PhoE